MPKDLRKVFWIANGSNAAHIAKAPSRCINVPEQYKNLMEKYGPRKQRSAPVELLWLSLSELQETFR